MSGEKPRAPYVPIPRDSGQHRAVIEETIGNVPSIRPPNDDDRIAQIAITANAALQQVTALTTRVDGMTAGVDAQIQTSVKASLKSEIEPILSRLDAQDVDTSTLSENVTELLKIARARQQREQRESLAAIQLTEAEQKVFSGKGREVRLWVKTAAVIVTILAALGSAAGISHCEHAKIALPE